MTKSTNPLWLILSNVDYLYRKSILDLKIKYNKTLIGISWVFVTPLFFLFLYSVIQIYIYGVCPKGQSSLQFVLMMFCGLMSVLSVSETLANSSDAFVANKSLLMNSYMSPNLLIAQSSVLGFINCLIGISFAAIVNVLIMGNISIYILLLPVIFFLQFLFLIGLGWVFSILALLIKDLQLFIRFLGMALFIISPIAYTYDMIPPKVSFFIYLNPISYFILAYQDVLIFGKMPHLDIVCGMFFVSILFFVVGFKFFSRLHLTMVDYL